MPLARLIAVLASGVLGALLYFASLYGLYRFRSWASRVAVAGTALILIACSVAGTSAQSGVAASLSYLASYLWGAVLVLSYAPSFKDQFLRSADSLERPAR